MKKSMLKSAAPHKKLMAQKIPKGMVEAFLHKPQKVKSTMPSPAKPVKLK